jgi:hypothetical protein
MLVFIDESGHPRPNDSTDRPVLLAVCIKENYIRELTNKLYKIKLDIYGKCDVEIKATSLINKRTLTPKRTRNKLFVEKIIELIDESNINVFAIIMERPEDTVDFEDGILQPQYFYLLQRIEKYCQKHMFPMALIIFDEQDRQEDKKISMAFTNFLYQSSEGKSFEKILEVPLFVNSESIPGVQLADIMAGIVRHYFEKNLDEVEASNDFEKWIKQLYSVVYSKTENLREYTTGFTTYGFYSMSKSKFKR